MTEYMHLIGAEDVRRAGSSMKSAAESMQSAATSISETMERHQAFMDDWLQRFEFVVNEKMQLGTGG